MACVVICRVERKERARLKSVKFESNDTNKSASTSTLDRLTGRKKEKEKNNKKFTFFKGGKEQSGDDTSESESECTYSAELYVFGIDNLLGVFRQLKIACRLTLGTFF